MTMALITRVSRLFKADFHAILDRIEEPDVLLRQAIREMEDDLTQDRQRAKVHKQESRRLAQRKAEIESMLADMEGELALCFSAKKHDLARALIKRKLEAERLLHALGSRIHAIDEAMLELDQRITTHANQLDAMRQKAEVMAAETQTTRAANPVEFRLPEVSAEEVEIAFLREQKQRSAS